VGEVDALERWQILDFVKRTDVESFAMCNWGFETVAGKSLLDIGCGPGWLTVMYAKHGASGPAIVLTDHALELTRTAPTANGVDAKPQTANAERLPFPDEALDIVVSSEVLHHTPDAFRAIQEAYRVTRRGGTGLITLYALGIPHHRFVFPFVRAVIRLTKKRHQGADLAATAVSVEDFVRQYDGANNPVGIAKHDHEWRQHLIDVGWNVISTERHYFPTRMVPFLSYAPTWLRRFLDRWLGTMVYFTLVRR
jgi:SAM-dependent methyltransferase